MKYYLVSDWMTRDVVTAEPNTFMLEAHRLMRGNNIRRLPVVKRGKLVGIMTRSDVRSAEPSAATTLNVWEMNYLLAQLKVKDVMTKNPITVRPDDTIKRAAELMHENRIGALPVVEKDNHLVGIITESDVFRILISWFNEEHPE
jgi:acetoin utilization protein AcuB